MVRNWDTVRAILLKLEAAHTTLTLDQVDGIDPQEVGYHTMLLKDAGLIELTDFFCIGFSVVGFDLV